METGLSGKAKRVRIYVNEGDGHGVQSVNVAIMTFLHKQGASGGTVFRAIEGFGASGVIHTSRFVDLAWHLPIVIEWIDRADVVERLLPPIKEMVKRGLITVEDVDVELYCARPVRDVSAALRVADVMSREVVSVPPDAPVRVVVELMVGKPYRAVPVVELRAPVGIITNTDLIGRGGLTMPMQLLKELETSELHAEIERISQGTKTAADVMTKVIRTVSATEPLTHAAEVMASTHLKRLPVIDEHGALVGMLSRLDILRSAVRSFEAKECEPQEVGVEADAPVAKIMRRDVPMVSPDARVPEIVQAVVSTRLSRCLVVDQDRHVVGKITDAEVLDRITPGLRPSVLRSFVHRLPFAHPKPEELAAEQHAKARRAVDLMVPVPSVTETAPIREAITAMLGGPHKVIAVVDAEQRLVGLLDRADLLRGLVAMNG